MGVVDENIEPAEGIDRCRHGGLGTGAIAGNLLGAMYGVEAIPPELLDRLEARDVIEQIAHDLADVFVDGHTPDDARYPSA